MTKITAQDMGRRRWEGVSKKKRSEHARAASAQRMVVLTPGERTAIARKAAVARWGLKKKGKQKGGSKTI